MKNENLKKFLIKNAASPCPRVCGKTDEEFGEFGQLKPIEVDGWRKTTCVFHCTSAKKVNYQSRYAPAPDHNPFEGKFEQGTLAVCQTCNLVYGDVYDASTDERL